MTAITQDRKVKTEDPRIVSRPMAVQKVFSGVLMCLNASGYAEMATDVAAKTFIGVSDEAKDNSAGSAGDLVMNIIRSGFSYEFEFSGTAAITDEGAKAYVIDNQTVGLVGTADQDILAGVITRVDVTNNRVFVDIGKSLV